ncbi:MAG: hypothetical protein WA624_11465 [Methylocella sp.]
MKKVRDGEIAETVHPMNKTGKAVRSIVLRHPRKQDLFEDKGRIAITPSPAIAPMKTRLRRWNGIASAATKAGNRDPRI